MFLSTVCNPWNYISVVAVLYILENNLCFISYLKQPFIGCKLSHWCFCELLYIQTYYLKNAINLHKWVQVWLLQLQPQTSWSMMNSCFVWHVVTVYDVCFTFYKAPRDCIHAGSCWLKVQNTSIRHQQSGMCCALQKHTCFM